jgi:hypothetical protein
MICFFKYGFRINPDIIKTNKTAVPDKLATGEQGSATQEFNWKFAPQSIQSTHPILKI